MPLSAIIFDLDGTLLDSLGELAASANAALASLGLPGHPVDAYRTYVGNGMDNLIMRSLPDTHRDEATLKRLFKAMRDEYRDRWDQSRPYRGVPDMLDALVARHIPVAVLSNKPHDYTRRIVDHALGGWPWADVRGALPDVPIKPDPASALDMASAMGLAPADIAYMGDSDVDMFTATNAGMTGVGAAWGFRGRTELADAGADLIIDSPTDILKHLAP